MSFDSEAKGTAALPGSLIVTVKIFAPVVPMTFTPTDPVSQVSVTEAAAGCAPSGEQLTFPGNVPPCARVKPVVVASPPEAVKVNEVLPAGEP